jgi:hypothetical protein
MESFFYRGRGKEVQGAVCRLARQVLLDLCPEGRSSYRFPWHLSFTYVAGMLAQF